MSYRTVLRVIYAGSVADVSEASEWTILDIECSNRLRTGGFLVDGEKSQCLQYGDARPDHRNSRDATVHLCTS
jgi:hypothetical protein